MLKMNSEKTKTHEKKQSLPKTTNSFEKPFVSAKLADTFGSHIISRDLRDFENSPHSKIVGTEETKSTTMHPRISW